MAGGRDGGQRGAPTSGPAGEKRAGLSVFGGHSGDSGRPYEVSLKRRSRNRPAAVARRIPIAGAGNGKKTRGGPAPAYWAVRMMQAGGQPQAGRGDAA
jgi:hypothetical protein